MKKYGFFIKIIGINHQFVQDRNIYIINLMKLKYRNS